MKIVIDSAIPYIQGVLEPYFEVVYMKGVDICKADIKDCDAMFIRTRTKCNKELLEGSGVKFIGTATIGTDHIDLDYCKEKSIEVVNAKGCNSRGVVQWVMAAIMEIDHTNPIIPQQTTIGVVGVGNIGSIVANLFKRMGFNVLKNDPIRANSESGFINTELKELLQKSDFITFHTPLTISGKYPTKHLLNNENIKYIKPTASILNASRGGVVCEQAIIEAAKYGKIGNLFIDVWENEPNINTELLKIARVATYHIAGYSAQGKANASAMIIKQLANFFDIKTLKAWYPREVANAPLHTEISWANLKRLMPLYYCISADTHKLKIAPDKFEDLRNNYKYRNEFF